ncbi:phage tail tape measure protein [Lachnospiraceae bacterium 62-35]
MADNYNGKIVLEVDIPKTVRQINADIDKLQKQLKHLKLNGTLDTSSQAKQINAKIAALQSQLNEMELKVGVDTSDIQKAGQAIKQETAQAQSILAQLGQRISSLFENTGQKLVETIFSDSFLLSKTKEALSELMKLDRILSEIGRDSNLTGSQLKELGSSAFEAANQYGRPVLDYLLDVQNMYRAGYSNASQMAELSSLAQSMGNLKSSSADRYLSAVDAAYEYSGSVEKLTAILDGQSQAAGRNAVSMEELAEATRTAALQAAQAGISEKELTAILGTGIASTKESGEAVGKAVKEILLKLQQLQGESGAGTEIISSEQLQKIAERCRSLGVELTSIQNGLRKLRSPVEILKELGNIYNSLPDDSEEKAAILSDLGGNYNNNVLSGILSSWDIYEKMLGDYENASGTAMEKAARASDTWEGSLNRLSNTWISTIGNIADSDFIITAADGFDGLLGIVNSLAHALGNLPLLSMIGGGIAGAKGLGLT